MLRSEMNQDTFVSKKFGISDDTLSSLASNWSAVAPIALSGIWLFRKFPKATVLGIAAFGAFVAYQNNVGGVKEAFEGEVAHIH